MKTNLLPTLEGFGFTPKEAKIYLSALELGSAPASTIARNTGLKRVTVYSILKDFVTKNLCTKILKDGVQYFTVVTPDILANISKQRAEQIEGALPELMQIANAFGNRPKVDFFEGIEGVVRVYNMMLSSNVEIHSFASTKDYNDELLQRLYREFTPKRVKKKLMAKRIMTNEEEDIDYAKNDEKDYRQTLMIKDLGELGLSGDISLYGPDKVALMSTKDEEIFGVIIHSKFLYTALDAVRQLNWNNYEKKLFVKNNNSK